MERRNAQKIKLRVLISGRELVVQENESEFRRPRRILTLLPYFQPKPRQHDRHLVLEAEEYHDPNDLLKHDLRAGLVGEIWRADRRGYASGRLNRDDLAEITAQPLLNYLVALSFTRDRLDFSKDINLNAIYADLLTAVHERGYEKRPVLRP